MGTIDLTLFILTGIGGILGFMKGFIKQIGTLVGWIIGLIAANRLYHVLAVKIAPVMNDSMSAAQVLAFILIWLAVPLIFAILTSLLTKLVETISLGGFNRLLGAAVGIIKVLLICSLLIGLVEYFDKDNKLIPKTTKSESVLYYPMNEFTGIFLPAAKEMTEQYIIQ